MKHIAWFFIGLYMAYPVVFYFFNLDFATVEYEKTFKQIWLFLIPISSVVLIVTSKMKANSTEIVKYFLMIVLMGWAFLSWVFTGFCDHQFREPLYHHKSENKQLRYRTLDCGAIDSHPETQLVSTYFVGSYLFKYSNCQWEEINLEDWNKSKSNIENMR